MAATHRWKEESEKKVLYAVELRTGSSHTTDQLYHQDLRLRNMPKEVFIKLFTYLQIYIQSRFIRSAGNPPLQDEVSVLLAAVCSHPSLQHCCLSTVLDSQYLQPLHLATAANMFI